MRFDLLIKGGTVLDPASGIHEQRDVAVRGDRIAAVDRAIPAESAFRTIDAAGQLVTPGLIDLHTHVYPGATYWGISAAPLAWRTGVTTWVDAGSAGAYTLNGFREYVVAREPVRLLSFLNISSIGLAHETYELATLQYCNADLCVQLAHLNRDLVRGIKVRMGSPTVGVHGLEPMRRARAAADATELPLMVHIGHGPPEVEEVLELMQPGDLLTHALTGASMKITTPEGQLREGVRRALDRGVLIDVGHGFGGFSFATAEVFLAAGYRPDVISTDLHQLSVLGPVFDLPTCLDKFLSLGMSPEDVVRAATARPAEILGLQGEIGTLSPGAAADMALFNLETGDVTLYDTRHVERHGNQRLRNTLTIARGKVLPPVAPEPPAPWITPNAFQRRFMTDTDAMLRTLQPVSER
ncbi:MAG TPA: amidohydrolase/deacetylase family metallohydrolase [Chloroflexota bacterium]|nr:amidohydrolase/deacetylase family metallohydrolase [Chloroflexota bacterium]